MDNVQNGVEVVRIGVFKVAANILNDTLRKVPREAPFVVWFVCILAAAETPREYFDETVEFLSALLKGIRVVEQQMIVLNEGADECLIADDVPEEGGKVNIPARVHPCYVFVDIILYLKLV